MTDRRLAATCLVVTAIILAGYTAFSIGSDDRGGTAVGRTPALAGDPDDNLIPRSEVARHSSRDDCWSIIDDEVYDLTDYIGSHPGGIAILEACGTDATTLFEERRRTDGSRVGSGEEHSDRAEDQLEELQVGVID